MLVTADQQRLIALPAPARPGDTFDLRMAGDGFLLTRLDRLGDQVRLERRNGYLIAVTEYSITHEQTRKALDEFPTCA